MDTDERKLAELLGRRLRALRQARGWTQAFLAEGSGVTTHYVALLETARKLPTLKTLGLLAKALGVSPGKLLEEDSSAPDSWAAEMSQIASAVPEPNRLLVRDILKAATKLRAAPSPTSRPEERRPARSRAWKRRGNKARK